MRKGLRKVSSTIHEKPILRNFYFRSHKAKATRHNSFIFRPGGEGSQCDINNIAVTKVQLRDMSISGGGMGWKKFCTKGGGVIIKYQDKRFPVVKVP